MGDRLDMKAWDDGRSLRLFFFLRVSTRTRSCPRATTVCQESVSTKTWRPESHTTATPQRAKKAPATRSPRRSTTVNVDESAVANWSKGGRTQNQSEARCHPPAYPWPGFLRPADGQGQHFERPDELHYDRLGHRHQPDQRRHRPARDSLQYSPAESRGPGGGCPARFSPGPL